LYFIHLYSILNIIKRVVKDRNGGAMEYSAGMVSQLFAFVETRKTAQLLSQGFSKEEARKKIETENLYQLNNANRLRRTFNYIYKRLYSLPKGAIELLVQSDTENAKLLTLIGIMNTDGLFFEFVYEVYRGKVILGEKTIQDRDMNIFFDEKVMQSEEVASWSQASIKKLKSCYLKNLADAGLIESTKTRRIKHALVNYRIEELLTSNGMGAYINAIKGA
jgi:hypothetical protein